MALVLAALQPFLFTHFRQDGWEDEPGFRVRSVEATAQFTPDERKDHSKELETTLYAPAAAHTDVPHAFERGLDVLMALVALLSPLAVALLRLRMPIERVLAERAAHASGAPPPPVLWRMRPPHTAPPLTT